VAHGCFAIPRMPISAVFDNLPAGATVDEISEWFEIPKELIVQRIDFTARSSEATAGWSRLP